MLELKTNKFNVTITGDMGNFIATLSSYGEDKNLEFVRLKLVSEKPSIPSRITLAWTHPTSDLQGQWNPILGYMKSMLADWAWRWRYKSTSGAPVHSLFKYNGNNSLTFALSDALNPLEIKCGVNEETAVLKCSAELFIEPIPPITEYEVILRLNGSFEKQLILNTEMEYKTANCEVYNCCGELINKACKNLIKGINVFDVPAAGTIIIR